MLGSNLDRIIGTTINTKSFSLSYSLIKMLYWMCKRSRGHFLTGPQLEHAIKRNFGGLESNTFSPVNIFKAAIDFKDSQHWPKFSAISEEVIQMPNALRIL